MSGDPELPRKQHLKSHHRMRPRHDVLQPPQRRRLGSLKPTGPEPTPCDHNSGPMCVGEQSAIDALASMANSGDLSEAAMDIERHTFAPIEEFG